jgi:FdhE protein
LAATTEVARAPLLFAAGLYRAQAIAAAFLDPDEWSGDLGDDACRLGAAVDGVLRHCAETGPPDLAATAQRWCAESEDGRAARLRAAEESGGADAGESYVARALLRPYLEVLRARGAAFARSARRGPCPYCGGRPWVAARRDGALLEGARRLLVCSACGLEWPTQRILCPACAEADPVKLPAFRDQRHPIVRLEACETCRRYVKSLDLSEDARPIPEIDDLLSLSMDLWAREQGFSRIEPGLAGL